MATYKDILLLVDKVSVPLKKIQKNTRKVTQQTSRFKDRLGNLTKKLNEISAKLKTVGARVGAFSKKVASAYAAVSGAVLTVGSAIIRGANKAADLGDRIDKMSQKIGMGRKAFQEWDYIMSQNGGNVESLQMGFKTLTTQIEGVQKGSKDSINAFKALGVSVKDSNGQFRKQDDVFNDTIRALQKIQDPTKKSILANRLFGRSAAELKPLLNQSADAIDELRKTANKKGLILSDKEIDNAVKYKDTMDTFLRFFEAKFAGIMMKIMPDLSKALEEIMKIVNENKEVFDDLGQTFKWIVGTAVPGIIKSITGIAKFFRRFGELIGIILGNILSFPNYISIVFNELKTKFIIIGVEVGKAIKLIANRIKSIFQEVIKTIMKWIQNIIDKISWVIGKLPGVNNLLNDRGIDSIVNRTSNDNRQFNSNDNRSNFGNTYNTTNNYNSMFPLSNSQYIT